MRNNLSLLHGLIELSNDIVWTATTDGKLLFANATIERVYGRSLSELLGNPCLWLDSIHADDKHKEQLQTEFLLKTRQVEVEYRIISADGQVRWLLDQRNVICDETLRPIGIGGIAIDITERKQIEQALQDSEARYRAIVENQPEFVVVFWQPDGTCEFVNEACCCYFQQAREQFVGSNFMHFAHEDDRQMIRDRIAHLTPENPMITGVHRVHRPDGAIGWLEWTDRAVFDNTGRMIEIQSVGKDITPRKQAQEALTRQKEILQTIIDNIPVMIAFFDSNGQFMLVNREWERALGWTFEEVREHTNILAEVYPERDYRKLVRELITSAEPSWHELKTTTKQGQVLDTLWAYVRLLDGTSIGIGQDVSDLKKMEEQLYQSQKIESIGRLAGGIAHDFNNILVPIIGYAELGLMNLTPDHKLYANLAQIRKAAGRAADLTRQILAFGRRQLLEVQVLDLNKIIIEFEGMLRRLIGEDIQLQTFLASSPYLVTADKTQIEQVLMNLVINARDAMPQGGKLTLETANVFLDEVYIKKHQGPEAPGHYVMLAVSDTGHGMDAETKKQIFEPFFTTKERGKGTGLGLSTVFGIIKQHQGNIWVYSEPGQGTTFKIYLPQAEGIPETVQLPTIEPASVFGTETILVVEDDEMLLELVCETLESHRYHVLKAKNPDDGLQLSSTFPEIIHLLLTDVVMPVMNGREFYRRITIARPDIKVLYMSGYTDNVIVHHGILDKGVNFIQKPFNIHNLTRKIRGVLG